MIAITSLLSSTVLASVSGARESARDVRRLQDMRQLRIALEQYYNDNGEYPPASGDPSECYKEILGDGSGNADQELSAVMANVPQDPLSGESGYRYIYDSKFSTPEGDAVLLGFQTKETDAAYQTVSGSGLDFSLVLYPAPTQLSCSGLPSLTPYSPVIIPVTG